MFPGWGFASKKGKMAKRSREWLKKLLDFRIGTMTLEVRTRILQFGADCYRAGYRAALEKKR